MDKGTAVREAFKLALSMALMYWLALWQNWDMPGNGGLAIALVSMGTAGASFQKGVMRMVGTTWGVLMGFLGLALFGQSPEGFLVAATLYIILIGYMMQTFAASYAWFVAGFLPFMVWSSSYMSSDMGSDAFHYGSFRYLETTTGILIYTVVSVLLWPQRAGTRLRGQGKVLWQGLREWFGGCRNMIGGDGPPSPELTIKLAGQMTALSSSLLQAYSDSPPVREDKRIWETLRVNLRGFTDTLELWNESIRDCRGVDLEKRLPGLRQAIEGFDRRFGRLIELWAGGGESDDRDAVLLEPLVLDWGEGERSGCSHAEVAAVTAFLLQWRLLDALLIELMRGSRMLAGLDSKIGKLPAVLAPDRARKVLWDPQRLVKALFPATCFVVAYLFWIVVDPPGGPSVPGTVVAISLNYVLARMNAKAMLVILFIGLWVCIGPIYMWVMPALGNGAGLLLMIFVYTFVFGWLGAKKPVFKLIPLIMLTSVAGISNQQSYSFMALLGGAELFLLCLSVIAVVDLLWLPSQPERVITGGLRRFFSGCAAIVDSFAPGRGRAERRRHFESNVLGVPASIHAAAKQLSPADCPSGAGKEFTQLVAGLQAITLRLQAVELAHKQLEPSDGSERLGPLGVEIRELLITRLLALSDLDGKQAEVDTGPELNRISRELASRLKSSADDLPVGCHALLGSVRGLLEAINETRQVMARFNWSLLAKARF